MPEDARHLLHVPLRRLVAALVVGLLWVVAHPAPPPAAADSQQFSIIYEDNLLVYGTDAERVQALRQMHDYGINAVRVTVLWSVVAGDAKSTPERAAQFDPANPATYPPEAWDRYDHLIELAADEGIGVYLDVTGPGPPWAHHPTSDSLSRPAWIPRANEFGKFMRALGTRYSGTYADENDNHRILPAVHAWAIWNEPNQPASLTPQSQYDRSLHEWVPFAPIVYRELYWSATSALRATGHGDDQVFMGETAPLGKDEPGPRKQLRPKLFIRELFCIRGDGRPYTGAEAAARRCGELRRHGPFLVTAWTHHPYTQAFPPWHHDPSPDSVNMSNVGELGTLLDQMADRTGLIDAGLPIILTEIGWRTNPPNPYDGVSPARQAEYMNVADHMAYTDPRVVGQTQFLLRDVGPRTEFPRGSRAYWYTWQSGLFYADSAPKPSLQAYLMPIDVRLVGRATASGQRVSVWGQVRPPGDGGDPTVSLRFMPRSGGGWRPLGRPIAVHNLRRFYQVSVKLPAPGLVRAQWRITGPPLPGLEGHSALASRAVPVRF